ncbi:MAG: hypothetical protein JHC33_05390 [Ignisphaera sp.]|nr:hypothetical protein [Ignisphaera sp.]
MLVINMMLSSGKFVKNPQLILRYVEELKKRGIDTEPVTPSSKELELVEAAARRGESLLSVLEKLVNLFKSRIIGEIAREVAKEVLGQDLDEDTATYLIARELAGWVLEIAEALNIIRISNALR